MQLNIKNGEPTCVLLTAAFTPAEIDDLIDQLAELKKLPDQHFHLTASRDSYIDVEISLQPTGEPGNAAKWGFAIEPDG